MRTAVQKGCILKRKCSTQLYLLLHLFVNCRVWRSTSGLAFQKADGLDLTMGVALVLPLPPNSRPDILGRHPSHFPAPLFHDHQAARPRPSLPPDPTASGPKHTLFSETIRPGVTSWVPAWSTSADLLCDLRLVISAL